MVVGSCRGEERGEGGSQTADRADPSPAGGRFERIISRKLSCRSARTWMLT